MSEAPRNVVMLLTPAGTAAIAVVRIAGPGVSGFLARRFSAPTPDDRCVHGTLRDENDAVLDDPVIVCSDGGLVADLNLHGGPWVVESVLQLTAREDFARVEPSPIAHDAPSELEREMLAHLPAARTELALRTLLAQPAAWARLIDARPSAEILRQILENQRLANLLTPPRVAIVGAPNVGKSTLANQLFGQARSITADMPGTTRDWVGATANIDGLAVILVDTPGLRATDDPIEREAIARSGIEVQRADLLVHILDATAEQEDIPDPGAIVVINKIDLRAIPGRDDAIQTVALTGEGVDQLRNAIRERLHCGGEPDLSRAYIWTQRQHDIVTRALDDDDPNVLQETVRTA